MHKDHQKMLKAFGRTVRQERKACRLTLPKLAKLSGVAKGNLSKIENGGNCTLVTLYRVAWILGIEPMALLPSFKSRWIRQTLTED